MEIKKVLHSFIYAVDGIIYSVKTQRNMRIHYAVALLVLTMGFVVRLSKIELAVLFFTVSLVIAMELINTAIEATIDLITDKYHPLAKIAKNVAAGAVLVSSINAVAVGYVLFFDKFDKLTFTIITSIQEVPLYLYNSLVGILLLLIIVFKTFISDFKNLGLPSGQTTVAFAFVVAVLFLSENLFLTMCSIAIALMIAQNRMNNNRHSLIEVLLGAVLGILFGIIGFVVLL
ncbi:diacylglycerol kinase [Anaerobranca gottschalkii]|uniref:Diacylglycerol kinase (ATP) n=1 Tax=Anaerobranca gottschalkii DSM 13577 TaxID=1120990 RepID=A0A1H9YDA3_9FIRM|nr:diacylglycerol kinase [Anaerobranca gottschalkii]SES66845.1 diacylglycerol kinase (ATP) [Anaerobranca gottschalkii DSM 13577]